MASIGINIGGDVFLGRRVEPIAIESPESLIDKKILELFTNSDFNILNLESPLTTAGSRDQLTKTGPNLKASPDTVPVLRLLNTNLVTLANNHIYDYKETGLSDTLSICESNNIATVGAGSNLQKASEIFLKKIGETTLGIVNIAENEWCNANENRGGANPLNVIHNIRSIQKAKEKADVVILIIHGGHEYYYYPSPRMVELYRFYAEQGASIIVGHHSHCISGNEVYKGVPIYYSLGNFLFDNTTNFDGWYEGILLNIQIDENKRLTCKVYPCKQDKYHPGISLLEGADRTKLENQIDDINSVIADPQKLAQMFNLFVENQKKNVLSIFSTSYFINYRYFRSAIRKAGLEPLFLRRSQLKSVLNYFRCEAHRDISIKTILDYIEHK